MSQVSSPRNAPPTQKFTHGQLYHHRTQTLPQSPYSYPSQSRTPLHTLSTPCTQDVVDWFGPPPVICQSNSDPSPPPRKFPPHFRFQAPSCLPISPFPLSKILPIRLRLTLSPRNPTSSPFLLSLVPTCQHDSCLRLFAFNNCLVINPNCSHFPSTGNKLHLSHQFSSISLPTP